MAKRPLSKLVDDFVSQKLPRNSGLEGETPLAIAAASLLLSDGTDLIAADRVAAAVKHSETDHPTNDAFIFEGDSQTAGSTLAIPASQRYSALFMDLPFAKGRGTHHNFAVHGSQLPPGTNGGNNCADRYVNHVKPLRPKSHGGSTEGRAWLFLMIGTNDIINGGMSGETFLEALATYIATAKADGFTVVVGTILPFWRYTPASASHEQHRQNINYNLRGRLTSADLVWDGASVLAGTASTFWNDDLHPSAAGHTILASYLNFMMFTGGEATKSADACGYEAPIINTNSVRGGSGLTYSTTKHALEADARSDSNASGVVSLMRGGVSLAQIYWSDGYINISSQDGAQHIAILPDGTFKVFGGIETTLPTSNPGVTGRFWNDSGTVKVSNG